MQTSRKPTLRHRPQQPSNELSTNKTRVSKTNYSFGIQAVLQPSNSWWTSPSLPTIAFVLWSSLVLQFAWLSWVNLTSNTDFVLPTRQAPVSYPIILLGFPKSGSLAIHKYLDCHGQVASSHYCCGTPENKEKVQQTEFPCGNPNTRTCGACVLENLHAHQPAFRGCGSSSTGENPTAWSQFDVETANAWFLPQHFALGLIHEAYPNATWVLNTRSHARDWADSIHHWQSATRRILTTFGLPTYDNSSGVIPSQAPPPNFAVPADEIIQDMQLQLDHRIYNLTGPERQLSWLEQIYENHTTTVQVWARQFPSHRFLHLKVDEPSEEVLQQLDYFFGYDSTGRDDNKNRVGCPWTFEPPNDDWKDFRFPF